MAGENETRQTDGLTLVMNKAALLEISRWSNLHFDQMTLLLSPII